MAPSESQKRASLKWDKENMVVLSCKMKRLQAEAFKAHCEAQGKTSNTVLKNYVLGCIGEGEDPQDAAGGSAAYPAGGTVSLPYDTIKAAQEAAEATGEAVSVFIARAVERQAQRDKSSLSMGINPATGERSKKQESGE